jgi:Domain of unknown function (DUF6542)
VSERLSDAADSAEPAPPRQASGDGAPSHPAEEPAAADGAPVQSPPATSTRAQSPPVEGPPKRSVLSEKARAQAPGARPRRTAADVAREAAGESAHGSDERAGRDPDSSTTRGKTEKTKDAAEVAPERERPGGPWPMPDRSLMATVLGVHPGLAVGVAAALTAVGVAIDLLRVGTLGTAFTICYLTGCALATAWVRRSGVFWPMVAPPLLMALAVPVVVLVAGTPRPGAGIAQRLLVIGAPLVNGFPMMAWTTGLVLALGLFRLVTQREYPGRGATPAGGRTSASPRRS